MASFLVRKLSFRPPGRREAFWKEEENNPSINGALLLQALFYTIFLADRCQNLLI